MREAGTRSHAEGDLVICHSCYNEQPELSRSLLAEARGSSKEDSEMDDLMDQLPTMETDDAFYTDVSPIHEILREQWDEIVANISPSEEIINQLRDELERTKVKDLITTFGEMFVMSATVAASSETHEDMVGLPPRMMEYLLGLICTIDPDQVCEDRDMNESLEQIVSSAEELIKSMEVEHLPSEIDSLSDEERQNRIIEIKILSRELTAGRFVYPGQYFESAERAYTPHNNVLESELGFTIQNAIDFTIELSDLFKDRYQEVVDAMGAINMAMRLGHGEYVRFIEGREDDDSETILEEYLQSGYVEEAQDRMAEAQERYSKAKNNVWVSQDNLFDLFEDDRAQFEQYLSRMSVSIGSIDEDSFRYPYDHNPLHASPILELNGESNIPHFQALFRALSETYYYDLISHPEYGSTDEHGGSFGEKWGDYVENWSYDSLIKIFPEEHVYLNPKYSVDGEKYETDILVLYDGYCLIFESKTKKMTLDTRSGDYEAIQNDVLDGIGEGYDQAIRLIDFIRRRGSHRVRM